MSQVAGGGSGPHEYLYKVLVVGDIGTGKTSIIKQFVHHIFSQHYKSTIGVDFALKVLNWDNETIVRLQLWDIAGQERFGNMTRVYYKEAVAAIVVYDVTRPATFEAVSNWKFDIDHKVMLPDGTTPIPCVLLGNKCDLPSMVLKSDTEMEEFCREHGFIGWFETSAKEDTNIDKAISFLVERILENDARRNGSQNQPDANTGASQQQQRHVSLDQKGQAGAGGATKSGCCN